MSLHFGGERGNCLFSTILARGERVFAHLGDSFGTMRPRCGASCAERRKLPRCELGDASRSIHSRETGRRDNAPVFARLGLQNRIVHFPPVARVSSDFLLLFLSSTRSTPSWHWHYRSFLPVYYSPIAPSPAAGRDLEYVARKTTTVVVALRLLTT